MTASTQRFLFLEILDPEIHALLSRLRREFGQPNSGVHVTVRGPYREPLDRRALSRFERIVNKEPLLIHQPGIFENAQRFSVYLRAESEALRLVWHKPDFPIRQYGFNPHITIHEGKDGALAKIILHFLLREDLRLLCHDVRLREYASKQHDMFGYPDLPDEDHFFGLSNRRLVKADILQRAENLVRAYRKHPSTARETTTEKPANH